LYLFGRNAGVSIICPATSEEGSIFFGNSLSVAYASINTGSGTTSVGGDMNFRVGSNTTRMTITSAGNVGIGIVPVAKFMVNVATNQNVRISQEGGTGLATISGVNDAASAYASLRVEGSTLLLNSLSGGNVLIGTTTDGGPKLQVYNTAGDTLYVRNTNASMAATNIIGWVDRAANTAYDHLACISNSQYQFRVSGSGTLYAQNTSVQPVSSDVNLKTDIKHYDKGLTEVLAMKPRYFKYKDNIDEEKAGFIAQEMNEAVNGSMVDGIKNSETNEVYKTYQIDWYPLLVKAIQEMNTKIIQLEKIVATK
jgi:hypothetical protein